MGEREDYLTSYREFFEHFAATVKPNDQLPVHIPVYLISEAEIPGDVFHWIYEYLERYKCPSSLYLPLQRIILAEVQAIVKKNPNDYILDKGMEVYRPIVLMQTVIARTNDVCLRYLDNSQLDTLPPPQPAFRTVSAAMRNSRRVMEDRHTNIANLEALFGIETTEPTSFYAVYDGHAGTAAAHYCTAHLHRFLVESPHFTNNLKRALRDAFLRTDAEFIRKSKHECQLSGGSTAVVVCVRGRQMFVAWAGDSLALVAQRMRVMQLVYPHKPSRKDEKDRIERMGGSVLYYGTWRVNGQLAVSRAIGDANYKPYVTARPEVGVLPLDGEEDFVVLACDGLWDFVSEDQVALAVYQQIATDPDDLKAVTKLLTTRAKAQGSEDNISIIVVFLKEPRDIAIQNCPPMELGLDNAVVNAPPLAVDGDAHKKLSEAAGGPEVADNGVSDSDSDDLGPETAVDMDADDNDVEMRLHEPAPPTPLAHTVEDNHVDGNLVDNVGESGDDSEDEWNYFKGEGDREQNPSEEVDEPLRSETPCQDNSAWETSSVDMNSSPLNPDAPVFVPGSVGSDVLLAESPRKPLPMDDIDVPDDVDQFETEAVVRPAELQDLDNCDQLNGHHNISIEGVTEHLNGNDKCQMDSLGFGFNVGIESDKIKDTAILQDFERIQKDTTDFCNIQVFQTMTETNPFGIDGNDDFLERLKNKERDPMSMSFYQEKDDDTCDRFNKNNPNVDLNAVQTLPDNIDDDDLQENNVYDNIIDNKENMDPDQSDISNHQEPNNDIRYDGVANIITNDCATEDNMIDNITQCNNMQNYTNIEFECNNQHTDILPTDTPESHKLLFEQIPEIPDGKSSELGFANDELDPLENEKEQRNITPQFEVEDNLKQEFDLETKQDIADENKNEVESTFIEHSDSVLDSELITESDIPKSSELPSVHSVDTVEYNDDLPETNDNKTVVDVHQAQLNSHETNLEENEQSDDLDVPKITLESDDIVAHELPKSPEPHNVSTNSPIPNEFQQEFAINTELRGDSPVIHSSEDLELAKSPSARSPEPNAYDLNTTSEQSPLHNFNDLEEQTDITPAEVPLPSASPAPVESHDIPIQAELSLPVEEPIVTDTNPVEESSMKNTTSLVEDLRPESPSPSVSPLPAQIESTSPTEDIKLEESQINLLPDVQTESQLLVDAGELIDKVQKSMEDLHNAPLVDADQSIDQVQKSMEDLHNAPLVDADQSIDQVQKSMEGLHNAPLVGADQLIDEVQKPIEDLHNAPLVCADKYIDQVQKSMEDLHNAPSNDIEYAGEHIRLSPLPAVELRNESPQPIVEQTVSPVPDSCQFNEFVERQEPTTVDTTISKLASPLPEPSEVLPYTENTFEAPIEEAKEVREDSAPAPDVLPEHARSELVTDIDIGIPESRAQEICVAVTSELQQEEDKLAATPPPTPAVQPAVSDTLIAAPVAAAAAVGAATLAVKSSSAKKTPTTPISRTSKPTPKSDSKLTTSTSKRTTTTPRLTAKSPTKTPVSATKPAPKPITKPAPKPALPAKAAPKPPVAKEPAVSKAAPAKLVAAPRPATKPAPRLTVAAKPAPSATAPRPKTALSTKPSTTATSKLSTAATSKLTTTTTTKLTTTTTKTTKVPAPAAPKPATRPVASKPTTLTSKPKEVKAKAPEKPLQNGDVKSAAKPAPRPITRPTSAAVPPKTSTTRPAPRAHLDKPTKEIVNKRLTADSKTAPSRTAPAKTSPINKNGVKSVAKRNAPVKKEVITNGVNGSGDDVIKPPPTPPPSDNALLPDVIA
ncbi:uncharacterized protein LOC126969063 isoform X3 [Leptidea sinapis]|uniref:uncharacterized protein LOC126969063 isoform X3 n=1 Tax=Leptidea sinapis TaxID=189913 RepID=UPI0021C2E670|nr:uncharacterized protein LOC126969063 isoform X3 [Leptidea sinapis]